MRLSMSRLISVFLIFSFTVITPPVSFPATHFAHGGVLPWTTLRQEGLEESPDQQRQLARTLGVPTNRGSFAGGNQIVVPRVPVAGVGLEEPYLVSRPDYRGPCAVVGKIGGTTLAFQAAIAEGLLVGTRVAADTVEHRGVDTQPQILDRITDHISQVIDQQGGPNQVLGVYFSAPGFFNPDGTLAEDEENIPGLKAGLSFEREIAARLAVRYPRPGLGPIPVRVEHDATAAAKGERSAFGSHPDADDLFFMIAGTGIGTRRILNGQPFLGGSEVSYLHNEYPHGLIFKGDPENPDYESVILQTKGLVPTGPFLADGTTPNPRYGKQDLEDRTSGPNIARCARELAASGQFEAGVVDSLRAISPEGDLEKITTKELGEAAYQGNPLALKAIQDRARELGIGLAVLLVESNRNWPEFTWPTHIVLGSGVAQIGALFLDAVKEGFRRRLQRYQVQEPGIFLPGIDELTGRIELSQIKDDPARELLAGLPSPAQVAEHAQKLQALGGLEEGDGVLLKQILADPAQRAVIDSAGFMTRSEADGSFLTVAKVRPETAPVKLYLQEGLPSPTGLPDRVVPISLGTDPNRVHQTWQETSPDPSSVVIWNTRIMEGQAMEQWRPAVLLAELLASPSQGALPAGVIAPLAEIARKNGRPLEVRFITYQKIGNDLFALIRSA